MILDLCDNCSFCEDLPFKNCNYCKVFEKIIYDKKIHCLSFEYKECNDDCRNCSFKGECIGL